MQIQVLSVTGMPLGVQVWIEDGPAFMAIFVDSGLLSADGALVLQSVFNDIVGEWDRQSATPVRPHLRAVAG